MATVHGMGMGRHRDLPDIRDHTAETDNIVKVLSKSTPLKAAVKKQPPAVDLRKWCSPVEDQGSLGSCTANAGVGMLEYYEKRTTGKHIDGSRLFLYKVTRELLGFKGDDGAYLRDAMKAMVLFGVPPEKYWPYHVTKFNFGFSVYSSIPPLGDGKGEIPFPEKGDSLEGGHAVLAVGYDDNKKIGNNKGALLIRNSWSEKWGDKGYGWLPYAYVEAGLADDFWSMVKAEYVDTDLFK